MKVTKNQLRRIIKEEKAKILEAAKFTYKPNPDFSLNDDDYAYDLLAEEVESFLSENGRENLTGFEVAAIRYAFTAAIDKISLSNGDSCSPESRSNILFRGDGLPY